MAKNVNRIKKRTDPRFFVNDVIQDYLRGSRVQKLSPTTRKEYEEELSVFAKWCSNNAIIQKDKRWMAVNAVGDLEPIQLHQINDQVIHLFLEYLRKTHKPRKSAANELSSYTLSSYVRVIRGFLNWCLMDDQYCEQVKAITVQRIQKPKIISTIIETFSSEHIAALFEACNNEESEHLQVRDRAILSLLLDTGIRATELITLTIGNVNLDAKDPYVRVFGKGSKWGEVGLGEQARRNIQRYIRMFREPTIENEIEQQYSNLPSRQVKQIVKQVLPRALVIVNRNGDKLTCSGLWRIIDRLGKWADIEGVRCSPHTFRHTFAAMFIRNGGDIYTLSKLLRHSSVKVTEEYLKSLQQSEARRGARSVLDNL